VAERALLFFVYVNGWATARVVSIKVTANSCERDMLRGLGGVEVPSLWMGPRDVSEAKAKEIWCDGFKYEAGTKVSRMVVIGEGPRKRIVTEPVVLEVDFIEAPRRRSTRKWSQWLCLRLRPTRSPKRVRTQHQAGSVGRTCEL
jgi:hypothetical protein